MTRDELVSIGTLLWGERWQSDMARFLDRSPRLVRYWVAGERPIPDDAAAELRAELNRQLPAICARFARLWAMLKTVNEPLALDLARKLPTMRIE